MKKLILIFGIILVLTVTGILVYKVLNPQAPLTDPSLTPQLFTQQKSKTLPSNTYIEYSDPSGFSFNYPDNLSIAKKDIEDNNTYADLQLSSKDISGSISLKITDSKFSTLDEWLKINKDATPKAVNLGSIKAYEIQLPDRLLLGALDKGVFFSIEVPGIEKDFWMPVYNKILTDFAFAETTNQASQGNSNSAEDITFESEEVIE